MGTQTLALLCFVDSDGPPRHPSLPASYAHGASVDLGTQVFPIPPSYNGVHELNTFFWNSLGCHPFDGCGNHLEGNWSPGKCLH